MKSYLALLLTLPILLLTYVQAEPAGKKPVVFVPVLPYQYVFERIGGDQIEVHSIVPSGGDPHGYSPSPRQVTELSKANLIFSGGLPFEGNFFLAMGDGVNSPKTIDLLEGLDLLAGSCEACEEEHHEDKGKKEKPETNKKDPDHAEDDHDHDHDHAGHDHAEGTDSHVWLSPAVLLQQSDRIASILKEHTPAAAHAKIDENLAAFKADLETIDQDLKTQLAPIKGRSFYVYHGAFAYFAREFGLEQKVIEIAGRNPTPRQVAAIAKQAKTEGVTTIFVQPQFDETSALSLAETIGGTVQTLDPLEKDVLANLRLIARTLVAKR